MPRRRVNLNREWKFHRADCAGAERSEFDDSPWESVGLPHCFDIPYFRTPEFYVGYGWYRKLVQVENDWVNKRAFLEFDGVFQEAEVYFNGTLVGTHKGGYTGFSLDVTRAA